MCTVKNVKSKIQLILYFCITFLLFSCSSKQKTYQILFDDGYKEEVVGTGIKVIPPSKHVNKMTIFIYNDFDIVECVSGNIINIKVIEN